MTRGAGSSTGNAFLSIPTQAEPRGQQGHTLEEMRSPL